MDMDMLCQFKENSANLQNHGVRGQRVLQFFCLRADALLTGHVSDEGYAAASVCLFPFYRATLC